ncbi:S9 family peptidase [uncultured Algimonas sp.]|uniref:S9 family peptidase n=1 Tax=uncultured Algimonas sp. TaxID=1547920 RepID=UPI00260AFF3F|nr:S9 family peptidase [uncultured Algimonas sp.]
MKIRTLLCASLFAAACTAEAPPESGADMQDKPDAAVAAEPTALSHMEPSPSDADLDSDVAPYVLARGAGPSRLSPDGRTIATRLSLTGTRQLYVMDATADDPKTTLLQISEGSGITFFEFSPTGALIYGADNNGDERENYWLVEPDGDGWTKPRLLLPATDQGFRSFGGFTADGGTVVYSSTERNGLDYDIHTADVATGETALVFEGRYGNFVQAVAPDGSTAIISETVGEDSDRLFVLDLETGERTVLSDPDPRANHTDAGVHYLTTDRIVLATNRSGKHAAIETLEPDGSSSKLVARDADVDGLEVCDDHIAYTLNRDGFSELFIQGGVEQNVDGLPQGVYSIDCTDETLLVRISASNIPGDLYAVDFDSLTPRRVFASDYDDLDPASLILPQSVRIPARDGVELQGLLYLPDGVAGQPPVVFMVHGGPTAQSRPSYNATVQYLLSRGIAVFQPNVRGSTGFGRTYVTLDDQRKRLDSVRDLVDMLDWLDADGRVDTSRAAVQGGSYGGYMVNAVLADYPDAFDAGVALFGVGDWVTALEVASPALKASDLIEYGDIADPEWRRFYEEISPIAKAGNIRVPVLYSHGAMDPRIDKHETEVMVRALRDNGIRADYVLIPDEGHGWRKLSNRLWYERVQADFLEEVLGD